MLELDDLYQQIILDHNQNPRNYGILEKADFTEAGYNPMCGDKINVSIKIENDIINDIKFNGQGCAISQAAASMMTEKVKGLNINEAKQIKFEYLNFLQGKEYDEDILGKLKVLSGVKRFPSRIKCATLAYHALENALEKVK